MSSTSANKRAPSRAQQASNSQILSRTGDMPGNSLPQNIKDIGSAESV